MQAANHMVFRQESSSDISTGSGSRSFRSVGSHWAPPPRQLLANYARDNDGYC